ncbi:MAG TPA: BatD family protein, partial [Vicinamibacteria bacterium]
MKRKAGIIALLVLGRGLPGHAAEGALRSEVDARKIGLQDTVQLTITVEGAGSLPDDVAPPAFTNLRLVGGPAVSTQMSFVNGRVSQSRS